MPISQDRTTPARGPSPPRALRLTAPQPRNAGFAVASVPLRTWEQVQIGRISGLEGSLSRPGRGPDEAGHPGGPDPLANPGRGGTLLDPPAAVPAAPFADLAAIVEASPDVIYRADRAGRLIYLNPSGRKALGIEVGADLGGHTLASLHGPGDRATLRERVLPMALRDGTWTGFLGIRLPDGRDLPASLAFQAHRDADGNLQSYSAIFRDLSDASGRIAEAERARERAEADAQAKSELLARLGHELRTPLTSILGFAEYLVRAEELGSPATDRLDCLNLVRRNGFCLVELLDDMLDLSRIELGNLVPVTSACSPLAIAEDVAALLSRRAEEKGLRLEIAASDTLPGLVETDPLRVRQILINLVGNAIKFTEAGSVRIELSLAVRGGPGAPLALMVEVADTGPGLTPEQVARLGELFYQGDPGRPRDELGGTGLGLAISWQLAHRLGGSIDVTSTPGLGSRFRLTVPVRDPESAIDAVPVSGAGEVAFGDVRLDCRILLAEDVPSSRRAIAVCLEMAGAEVVAVGNGLDAVEAALSAERSGMPFDVVLLDIQMPVLDGPGAIRSLRHQGYARPVIVLTAESSRQDHSEYADLGCDGCVSKPVDWAELIGLIREHTGRREGGVR